MSKSSGLAIVTLLIAIGALGLGLYQIIFAAPTGDGSGIKNLEEAPFLKFYKLLL